MSAPLAGFIAPPDWWDPSPAEFTGLTGVESVGVSLDLGDFDWNLDRIARTEPAMIEAAATLAARGASVIGIVGTPFGWAGLDAGQRPHHRNERIASACGVPVVSAASGMLDWLEHLKARKVALAATYYDADWCERWKGFVVDAGFSVTSCASMADLGIVDEPLHAAVQTHWAPTPKQIEKTVVGVLRRLPADVVLVSGAGARTVSCYGRLQAAAGVPVVPADIGLYRALWSELGLTAPPGLLARSLV